MPDRHDHAPLPQSNTTQSTKVPLNHDSAPNDGTRKRHGGHNDVLQHHQMTLAQRASLPSPDTHQVADSPERNVNPHLIQQRFMKRVLEESERCGFSLTAEKRLQASASHRLSPIKSNQARDPLYATLSQNSDSLFGEDLPLDQLNIPIVSQHYEKVSEKVGMKPTISHLANPQYLNTMKNADDNEDDDDDMFGDDIPLDILDATLENQIVESATTNNVLPPNQSLDPAAASSMDVDDRNARYTRYIIISITLEKYAYNDDMRNEKVLLLLDQARNVPVRAHLRDDWWHALVAVGDIVHIPSSPTTNTSNIIIDNENNYLIIHPDRLISCTAVADSFFCLRKSVLQQKIKSISEYSEVLVHGNIIHQVIQQALQAGDFSSEAIQETIQRVVLDSLDELYAIDQDEDTAIKILSMMAPEIKAFGEIYVGSEPKPWAKISDDVGPTVSSDMGCETLSINRILDIEEHLWSPTYGLKGMIDASIQVKASPCGKILTIPLELKTGKSNRVVSHRAQTILYTLLMSDRYDIIISAGALFYSRTNTFYLVPAVRNELRSLILARNELAAAMNTRQSLPQMVKRLHSCQRCNMNDACLIYHKATENGTRDSSGLGNWFEAKTAHLSEEHSAFFRHWQQLIDMEENDIDHFRKDIWQQEPDKREMAGKCFDHMVISKESMVANRNMASGCWYTFVRDPTQSEEIQQRSLLSSQISVGDPVVVSSRQGHINLGMGMVKRLSEHAVTISLTRPLRRPPRRADSFDLETCQTFIPLASDYGIHADIAQVGYRIDLDEMSGSMALMRRNLIAIVNKEEDGGDVKRRQLIVELTTPSFLPANSIRMPNIPNLNPDQRTAVETVLRAQDYTLVLGMPGTGKTTTTAHIIKALADQKKSVLLTAYTHTALDNVLVKIREAGIDVLRLGNPEKTMPCLRDCMPNYNPSLSSVKALEDFYNSKLVVGTTCLGISHPLFQKRRFDYCIVDEASQITLPACIGPLRYADVFVLVGDQYQLPPVVRDDQARENGLDRSLFTLLAKAHPEAVVFLKYQYRMNENIMTVSNQLIYNDKLRCGNRKVASQSLHLPQLHQGLDKLHKSVEESMGSPSICVGSSCWLKDVMDPRRHVLFVDTDALSAREERPHGNLVQNSSEAHLIYQTAEALLGCGAKEDQIAVISVYRSQLRLISQTLRKRPSIEIATIDKYQGRDKDCVLVSLVRNNAQGSAGDLLRDWRRINVAFTRARTKLIVFGSASTLETSALFMKFLGLLEQKQWIYKLSAEAQHQHPQLQMPLPEPLPKTKERRVFTPHEALLKDRHILKDVYNHAK